jgi:methyltransferase family protein
MDDSSRPRSPFKRALKALSALNFNALRALAHSGPSGAEQYLTYAHRMYTGYGLPWMWSGLPWRKDLSVPQVPVQQLFPEIDFTHSPELLHPFPRGLSTQPHELMMLAHVVNLLKPERVIEFGTAEGRTALNLALHLPPNGEVVTLDFPPIPGQNEVGFFYWDQPLKSKIKQIFQGVDKWDSTPYHASAAVVFCDACDQPDGLAFETAQAFKVVKPGGVIFRHDYSSAEGPTLYWNAIAKHLPVKHLEGTTLLCLRVNDQAVYDKMQKMAASGRVIPT